MKNIFLVIDDDTICHFIFEKFITISGISHETHTARNGQQAITLLQERARKKQELPNIILLDLNMPIMNGFEFIKAFNDLDIPSKENIKIMILTSSEDPDDIKKTLSMGVYNYFSKPLTPHKINQMVTLAQMPAVSM